MTLGKSLEVEWITMDDVESENNDLRIREREMGAAIFANVEEEW